MAGLLDFVARFGAEERCIEHLAGLRWPGGFVCSGCGGRAAWRLKARPRVYECATCHRQELVTAGTVFHRTRTGLAKWFLAAYLMGREHRRGRLRGKPRHSSWRHLMAGKRRKRPPATCMITRCTSACPPPGLRLVWSPAFRNPAKVHSSNVLSRRALIKLPIREQPKRVIVPPCIKVKILKHELNKVLEQKRRAERYPAIISNYC